MTEIMNLFEDMIINVKEDLCADCELKTNIEYEHLSLSFRIIDERTIILDGVVTMNEVDKHKEMVVTMVAPNYGAVDLCITYTQNMYHCLKVLRNQIVQILRDR